MPPKAATQHKKEGSVSRKRKTSREQESTSPANDEEVAGSPKPKPRKPRVKKDKTKKDSVTNASIANDSVADSTTDLLDEVAEEIAEATEAAAIVASEDAEELIAAVEDADPLPEDTVRMSITTDKLPGDGDTEITRTTLKVELPANSPDLELPKDTEGVVEAAREIIEAAKELQVESSEGVESTSVPPKSLKRKADALDEADPSGPEEIVQEVAEGDVADLASADGEIEMRPVKRTRVVVAAEEYRREKVKRRALVGLSSALAVGVMVPFLSNLF